MITITLVYDRRKRAAKNVKGMIEIRVTLNRKSYYVSTNITVLPAKWHDGFVIDCIDAPELNERLRILMRRANNIVNEYISNGRPLDIVDIKKKMLAAVNETKVSSSDAINWIAEQIELLNVSPGTRSHYRTLLLRLTEYNQLRRWYDFTPENICAFDRWLHNLPSSRSGNVGVATIYNYHKSLRCLLNRAVTFGVIDKSPYMQLRGQFKRGDKMTVEYLTEDEMQAIMRLSLTSGSELAKARDIFVFQMFTGLAYSDAQAFDINRYKNIDDRWVMIGQRVKTGVPFVNELMQPAVDVLERNGWTIPRMTNQVYNRALKLIGEAAKIDTPVHSHLARHSFATMMLRNGAPIQNVSKMLGHTSVTQTERYAKVLAESVRNDFERMNKILQEKK